MSDNNSDAAQIEHELNVLRTRYALMERSAYIAKIGFMIFLGFMAVLAVCAIVVGNAVAILTSVCVLAIAALLVLIFPNTRWIDIVTPEPFAPMTFSRRTSEAEIVESQIAEREHRLANIKGTRS